VRVTVRRVTGLRHLNFGLSDEQFQMLTEVVSESPVVYGVSCCRSGRGLAGVAGSVRLWHWHDAWRPVLHRDGSGTHGVLAAYSTLFDCSPQIDRDGSGDVEYDEFLRGFEAWQVRRGGLRLHMGAACSVHAGHSRTGPHSAAYIGRCVHECQYHSRGAGRVSAAPICTRKPACCTAMAPQ
jgi:hypothetical protein